MAGHIATAKSTTWETPEWILEGVRDVFGGLIDLDPCASETSKLAVRNMHGPNENWDGLRDAWFCKNAFINPPFGEVLPLWVDKVYEEILCNITPEAILLSPANVETKIWQDVIFMRAQSVCFLRGRVTFKGAKSCAPMPIALSYWGPHRLVFKGVFGREHGMTILL